MMERRKFGTSGLTTSAVGMGCSRLGSFLSKGSDKEAIATVELAVERGIAYFDTADIYAQGDSERLLGTALGSKRDKVMIATKAGRRFSAQALMAARLKAPIKFAMRLLPSLTRRIGHARATHISVNFTPEYLIAALEASLKRLGTDRVDVFMLHSPPPEVLADVDLFYQLGRLTKEGKVRCLGVSLAEISHASIAARLPYVSAIQIPAGQSKTAELQSVLPELGARGVAVVGREVFDGIDRYSDPTHFEVVLRDRLAIRGLDVVLVGTSCRAHVEANIAAIG